MIGSAVLLAAFAILFGARRFERAGRSEGMVYAIGIESLIKLIAVVLVGALAFTCWRARPPHAEAGVARLASRFDPSHLSLESWVIALPVRRLVLPRQFYMGLVEARDLRALPDARWGWRPIWG
jgi:hypothetical protein